MQNSNLSNTGGGGPYRKKESEIRTMESDISKLLKEEKPSVLELIAKKRGGGSFFGAPGTKRSGVSWKVVGITAGFLAIFLAVGFFSYNYFLGSKTEPEEKTKTEEKPVVYVSYDEEAEIILENKGEFVSKINEVAQESARFGTLKKLYIKIANGEVKSASFKDFLRILEAAPPVDLEFITSPELQQFIYYSDARPAFVSVFKVGDTVRALQDMLSWEPRIPAELNEFLLGASPEINIVFFEDKTHGGVSYRFAKMSFSEDFGFGYFVMPEKKFLIWASSEEAIRIVINRMLEP